MQEKTKTAVSLPPKKNKLKYKQHGLTAVKHRGLAAARAPIKPIKLSNRVANAAEPKRTHARTHVYTLDFNPSTNTALKLFATTRLQLEGDGPPLGPPKAAGERRSPRSFWPSLILFSLRNWPRICKECLPRNHPTKGPCPRNRQQSGDSVVEQLHLVVNPHVLRRKEEKMKNPACYECSFSAG